MSTNIFMDFVKAGFKPVELSLIANKENLFLEKDVYIDDELVESGRSHSLTRGFITALQAVCSQLSIGAFNNVVSMPGMATHVISGLPDLHIWDYGVTYTGGSTVRQLVVQIDGTGTPDTFKWYYGDQVGYPPPSWNATGVAITGDIQYLGNGIKIIFSNTTGHVLGGYQRIYTSGGSIMPSTVFNFIPHSSYPYETGLIFDASAQAVHLFEHYPISRILNGTGNGQLQYAGLSVTPPAVDATSSQITITRSASNGSGSPVTVNGFVLFAPRNQGNSWSGYDVMARDVFSSSKVVNAGSTITVNSRIKTSLGASGGFVRQFMDLLYRQAGYTSYGALDISNTSRIESYDYRVFNPLSIVPYGNTYGWNPNTGLVVGTDPTAVSMTDIALKSIIPHGSGAGQLRWFGTIVDPPYYDLMAKTVKFDMYAAFKNDSGGAITVKEIGWYGTHAYPAYAYLLARMVNANGYVTVNNGDGLIVKLTIGIQL